MKKTGKHDKVYRASVLAEAVYNTYRADGASRWHAFKHAFRTAYFIFK